jgi:hypothetical protein
MTLNTDEFLRRFLLHVLPSGFHRNRQYALLANARRKHKLKIARELLQCQQQSEKQGDDVTDTTTQDATFTCRQCGEPLIIVQILAPQHGARAPPQRWAA